MIAPFVVQIWLRNGWWSEEDCLEAVHCLFHWFNLLLVAFQISKWSLYLKHMKQYSFLSLFWKRNAYSLKSEHYRMWWLDNGRKIQGQRTLSSWTSNTRGSLACDRRLRRGPNCDRNKLSANMIKITDKEYVETISLVQIKWKNDRKKCTGWICCSNQLSSSGSFVTCTSSGMGCKLSSV